MAAKKMPIWAGSLLIRKSRHAAWFPKLQAHCGLPFFQSCMATSANVLIGKEISSFLLSVMGKFLGSIAAVAALISARRSGVRAIL